MFFSSNSIDVHGLYWVEMDCGEKLGGSMVLQERSDRHSTRLLSLLAGTVIAWESTCNEKLKFSH